MKNNSISDIRFKVEEYNRRKKRILPCNDELIKEIGEILFGLIGLGLIYPIGKLVGWWALILWPASAFVIGFIIYKLLFSYIKFAEKYNLDATKQNNCLIEEIFQLSDKE